MDKLYASSLAHIKKKFAGSIFPENIIFPGKNHRTIILNELLALHSNNINGFGNIEKEKAIISDGLSNIAPLPRDKLGTSYGLPETSLPVPGRLGTSLA